MVIAGCVLAQPSFQYYHDEIRFSNVYALRWVDNISLEKWTRVFDRGCRWGHMIANFMESMNNIFKGIRNIPITTLVRKLYFMVASLFATSGGRWNAVLRLEQLDSESCMKMMKEENIKAGTYAIITFDCHIHTLSVQKIMDHNEGRPNLAYVVILNTG